MRRAIILIIGSIVILAAVILTGNFLNKGNKEEGNEDKIKIIATLFPQYDFIKNIGGDKVDVTLLLPAGVESHSYEPTPKDIMDVNRASIFAYTGEEMEPWAEKIATSISSDTIILNTIEGIELINIEEFEEAYDHEHDHSHDHDHNHNNDDDHDHNDEHHEENKHLHTYDPHIWLNPIYAVQMVENIKNTLIEVDPENAEYYEENANNYIAKLMTLNADIKDVVDNGERDELAFGGPFAYAYFVEQYNLKFISAYDSCSGEVEPSVAKIKNVIDEIRKHDIPVVFYQELSSGSVARAIAEETNTIMLEFHTIHNVSKQEIEEGATYISIMRTNLENLKQAVGQKD